jgi:hypothetical protein
VWEGCKATKIILEYGINQLNRAKANPLPIFNEYILSNLNVALILGDSMDKFSSFAEISSMLSGFILKNLSLGSSLEKGGNEF